MQSAETVLGVLHERGRRGLRDMPPGHPCRTGHSHHPELNTGERYASKGARTVREGADGKGSLAAYFTTSLGGATRKRATHANTSPRGGPYVPEFEPLLRGLPVGRVGAE